MSAAASMLAAFHERLDEPFGAGDRDPSLRIRLHRSEMRELVAALRAGDRVGSAHELADNVIVAYGTAHSLGIPLDPVIVEVMAANMRKLGPDGALRLRADGKVLKPEGWVGPDVAGVLARVTGIPEFDLDVSLRTLLAVLGTEGERFDPALRIAMARDVAAALAEHLRREGWT